MTLRELINSVDSEQYSNNLLYQKLRKIKPYIEQMEFVLSTTSKVTVTRVVGILSNLTISVRMTAGS